MRCENARDRLGPWLDGELPPVEAEAVARHVSHCEGCSDERRQFENLGAALSMLRAEAPASLAALPPTGAHPLGPVGPGALPAGSVDRRHRIPSWARMAAVLAATALLSSFATWLVLTGGDGRRANAPLLQHDLVTAHVRAMMTGTAVAIATSDPHTVKPWFAGRIEVAPTIRDLSADGFPLAGGRLDVIDGRRVGVAVYMRRLHTISVFVWPATSGAEEMPLRTVTLRGFNAVTWSRAGVAYWAVSDLNAAELQDLARLL